jgi:hypothetical protein
MTRRLAHLAFLAGIFLVAACGTQASAGAPQNDTRLSLSSEEMVKAGYPDLYATVQSLRPQWLQRRGSTSLTRGTQIKVYLDGALYGGPETLRQITTRSVSRIQYLDGLQASARWGMDHDMGAIVVSTRKDTR